MKLVLAVCCLAICASVAVAQKGHADPDYYPLGYSGDTWTGEVTVVDNGKRSLTLTSVRDKKQSTFVAVIPEAPYERRNDGYNFRVIDFPFDKNAKGQTFRIVGAPGLSYEPLDSFKPVIVHRPNPPAANVINDFSDFKGRVITVYYMTRERTVDGKKEKYNDVWRIRIIPPK